MSSSLRAVGFKPSVAHWGIGMFVCCNAPWVQLFASADVMTRRKHKADVLFSKP